MARRVVTISGVEATIRWTTPDGKKAEETVFIHAVDLEKYAKNNEKFEAAKKIVVKQHNRPGADCSFLLREVGSPIALMAETIRM